MMLPVEPVNCIRFAGIMGAQLWYHEAPWHPDAAESLKALQAQFLAENYDLHKVLPEQLANARASVEYAKEDGDPYGLVDFYQEQVASLAKLSAQPIPENPEEQVELIRRVWSAGGDEIGNVLDVRGISDDRDTFQTQRLSDDDMLRLVGTAQPTIDEARQAVGDINAELNRGECVCFAVFNAGVPAAWCFVGNTVD